MTEMLDPSNLNNNQIHQYIHRMENNKIVIGKDIRESVVVEKLMSLSQVYTFFQDLSIYYKKMDLPDKTLEKFILETDDLIDAFEEYQDKKTASSQLLNDYYTKAEALYDLLVKLQFDLGFELSDRKYKV